MEKLALILYLISLVLYFLSYFFKHRFFARLGWLSLGVGLLLSLYLIARHFCNTKHLPLTNTSETLLSFITLVVLVFFILEYKIGLPKIAALLINLIAILGLYSAFYIFRKPSMPLLPALQSKWLVFHVSSCIIAYGFFTIAFIAGLVYLFKSNSDLSLFAIMHRAICVGFLFLTLGIILGSIWGKFAWGHWWNWDPKEGWALITWLIYACYLHGRLFEGWSEKRLVAIAILGFLSCLFTYLGVNFLLKGLHSYA